METITLKKVNITIPEEVIKNIIIGEDDSVHFFNNKLTYVSLKMSEENEEYFTERNIYVDVEYSDYENTDYITIYTYRSMYHKIIREEVFLKDIFTNEKYGVLLHNGPFGFNTKDIKFTIA